jgi:hypothetical protein
MDGAVTSVPRAARIKGVPMMAKTAARTIRMPNTSLWLARTHSV